MRGSNAVAQAQAAGAVGEGSGRFLNQTFEIQQALSGFGRDADLDGDFERLPCPCVYKSLCATGCRQVGHSLRL